MNKRYLTDARTMQRLLIDGDIHCFFHTQLVEWISDRPTQAGEGRLKVLCNAKRVYADNIGLYTIA